MKLTLRRKIILISGTAALGVVLLFMAVCWEAYCEVLAAMGVTAMIVSWILACCWRRCPRCDAPLGRNLFPEFCHRCGEKIDYDQ